MDNFYSKKFDENMHVNSGPCSAVVNLDLVAYARESFSSTSAILDKSGKVDNQGEDIVHSNNIEVDKKQFILETFHWSGIRFPSILATHGTWAGSI